MRTSLFASKLAVTVVALALPLTALAQGAPAAAPKAPAAPKVPAAPAAAAGTVEEACPTCPEPPPPPTTGTVEITVTPADAVLTLNGAAQKAGTEITAKPGTHILSVTKPGYDAWNHSFQLQAGGAYRFLADLRKTPPPPKKPTVVFNMKLGEGGASVTIDGKAVTAKKGEAVEVEPGEREIKISQKGKKDWVEKVTFGDGAAKSYGTWEAEDEDDALGPYVTIGLGVGLAALGLVFSAEDSSTGDQDGTSNGPSNNTDEDRATAAIVLYTVGGALVATGITLIVLNAGSDDDSGGETAFIAPYATGDEAGLAGVFTF